MVLQKLKLRFTQVQEVRPMPNAFCKGACTADKAKKKTQLGRQTRQVQSMTEAMHLERRPIAKNSKKAKKSKKRKTEVIRQRQRVMNAATAR